MADPRNNGAERPPRAGYVLAIIVSALGHAALFAVVFFLAPRWLHSEERPIPSYTVKIVDSLPAGDLGSHLPRLAPKNPQPPPPEQVAKAEPIEPKIEEKKPPEIKPPDDDKNAISLSTKTPEATPTPTPTPEPTPEMTRSPAPSHTVKATPEPTKASKKHPTPEPTPEPKAKSRPKATPVVVAKVEPTPSTKTRLEKLRQQLLAEELKRRAKAREENENADEDDDDGAETPTVSGPRGGGPVVGPVAREGKGYGIGPGTGSMGMLQDPAFLLYYQTVQDKIKKAWNFSGGSSDLTATVDFSIGADGSLTGVKIASGSNDAAFDDSVVRAIRRAAPFPPPPEKYRAEFTQGIEARFSLGDLKS